MGFYSRLLRALSTVLNKFGFKTRSYGHYIPFGYAYDPVSRDESYCYEWLKEKWREEKAVFEKHLQEARGHNDLFRSWASADPRNVNRPRFDQDWFPGLDGIMAYTMIRSLRPKKIIEVGSGHSTRFMAQAIKDGNLSTHLHSIDPVPRRDIDAICSQVTRQMVENVPVSVLTDLEAGDVFFIDSSHVMIPGNDVEILFNVILPQLKPGVIVHIHDIFLPWEYPNEWSFRAYNEQHALLGLLSGNRYRVLMSNQFVRRECAELLKDLYNEKPPGAKEASLWLQIAD